MTPLELLVELYYLGVIVDVVGDRVWPHPLSAIPIIYMEKIVEMKAEIIQYVNEHPTYATDFQKRKFIQSALCDEALRELDEEPDVPRPYNPRKPWWQKRR